MQYLVAAFLMPILGCLVDKYGRIIQFILMGGVLNLAAHISLLLLPDCQEACPIALIPYIAYGIHFTCY